MAENVLFELSAKPLDRGKHCANQFAAMSLTIAHFESSFRRDNIAYGDVRECLIAKLDRLH